MKVMNGSVMTLEEDKIFLSLAALLQYVSNFADSRLKVPRYRSSPTSWDHCLFSQCIQQQWSVSQNCFGVNCRLQLACLGKKREETVKPTCSVSKATSVPQTPQTNHSQCSSFVEALNLIVKSKSQPAELDKSTTELHVPSRRKKSSQSYCSVYFDFLALLRVDMTFDVTLRDDSSFGKLV